MKNINFVKNIDNLGRIVIPMDIRKKMNINTGDILSITCNDTDICLRKYSTLNNNYKIIEIIKYFVEGFNLKVMLFDKDTVVYSNVVDINSNLDDDLKYLIKNGYKLRNDLKEFKFNNISFKGVYNMLPIVSNEGIVGSMVVLGDVFDNAFEICNVITKIISLELNIS